MTKDFLFFEEGSIEYPYLKKFLENSGFTDANLIEYKKGAPKPDLVSIELSEAAQNPEVYKKEAEERMLKALAEYLDNTAEKKAVSEYNYYAFRDEVYYSLTVDGTVDEFVNHFKDFLKIYKG